MRHAGGVAGWKVDFERMREHGSQPVSDFGSCKLRKICMTAGHDDQVMSPGSAEISKT